MMTQRADETHDVETVVTFISVLGLVFMLMLAGVGASGASHWSVGETVRTALVLVAIGWPFALGLLTRWWPQTLARKRWCWLLCLLGIPVPAILLLGYGLFLVAMMLVYPWAFWMTRGNH